MDIPALAQQAVVAVALTSLVVESPLNLWLRLRLAGAPTEAEIERWRQRNLTAPSEFYEPPRAQRPLVDEGLQCPVCAASWAALCVVAFPGASVFLFPWAAAWGGARLFLSIVRKLEGVS